METVTSLKISVFLDTCGSVLSTMATKESEQTANSVVTIPISVLCLLHTWFNNTSHTDQGQMSTLYAVPLNFFQLNTLHNSNFPHFYMSAKCLLPQTGHNTTFFPMCSFSFLLQYCTKSVTCACAYILKNTKIL